MAFSDIHSQHFYDEKTGFFYLLSTNVQTNVRFSFYPTSTGKEPTHSNQPTNQPLTCLIIPTKPTNSNL
jgi:hypothetical protein